MSALEALVTDDARGGSRIPGERHHVAGTLLGLRTEGPEFPVDIPCYPLPPERGRLVAAAICDVAERAAGRGAWPRLRAPGCRQGVTASREARWL